MTRTKQRIKQFSSGMKRLSYNSQVYINKLIQVFFLIEHPIVNPLKRKALSKTARIGS